MRAARQRSGTVYYYYDAGGKPRKWLPLGPDYVLAVQKWSALNLTPAPVSITIGFAVAKYLASDVYAALSKGTQDDYKFALDKLLITFASAPLDLVTPPHLRQHYARRCTDTDDWKASKHRAARELSVLGMIFCYARGQGWTTNDPKESVKLKKLPGRKHVYIYDEMLDAVYEKAPADLRDAMDLAYYIGQRPADVLQLSDTNIRDGMLEYRQGKTGLPQRIAIAGPLATLMKRIDERKASHHVRSLYLVVDERGRKMTKAKLRARFEAARTAAGIAGKDFQFRDLRRKSGSDLRDQHGLEAAQDQLGHAGIAMTEHYTGGRGKKIVKTLAERRSKYALQKS